MMIHCLPLPSCPVCSVCAVHLRKSLESLQSSVARCRVSHWLLKVLTAEDVRSGFESGLADTACALEQLLEAKGASDVVSMVAFPDGWRGGGGGRAEGHCRHAGQLLEAGAASDVTSCETR
jgi:hypothetical protein